MCNRLVMYLLAAALAGGCTGNKKGEINRPSPRSMPYLTGVPVPERFELVDKLSEDYESGGVRFARHQYSGVADLDAIRDFYWDQMPLVGWGRVSNQNVKGRIIIRFEKKYEECTVEIERSGWFNRVAVQIVIKPFSRTPSEPPKRNVP